MKKQDINDALLATTRSLLKIVTPQLRAVIVDLDNKKNLFYIRFYYDGEVVEEILDLWDCAITEASAGLDPSYKLDDGIERIDFPKEMPFRGRYAYLRKE